VTKTIVQLFKDWMVAGGKAPNTASNYMTGVNTVSAHCGHDVFAIEDVAALEELYQAYGPKGEHAAIGTSNSSNVHNGLKQWLYFQRYRAEGPSVHPLEGRQQWDAFLTRWPVTKLRELTLEQYYNTGGDDSFFSWMRDRTDKLGDFREGLLSAGVRPRSPNAKNEPGPESDMQTDGQYLWYRILGDSAEKAFANLMAELMMAIDAVERGDLSLMDGLKNAPGSLVWKVAFLYQNRAQPLVLPFYGQKQLRRILGPDAVGSIRQLQERLITQRGDKDVLDFAAELERQALAALAGQGKGEVAQRPASTVPLNQILFGPPGTGKTYATIDSALEILDPEFLGANRENRPALKERFDAFAKVGQVRLVTFHQSFSYEDFVEGLRAESGDEGQLAYNVEAGVFKRVCDDARTQATQPETGVRTSPRIWKISINGTGDSPTKSYCLEHGEARIGWGKTGDMRDKSALAEYYDRLGVGDKGTLQYFAEEISVGDVLLCIHSADEIGAVGVVTGDYRYEAQVPAGVISDYQHVRPVNWIYRNVRQAIQPLNDNRQFTLKTVYNLSRFTWADLLSYLDKQGVKPVRPITPEAADRKPHVLIIDEINRGNVSRIFGELITLIEPSKREGADEALSVELPYSKKPFSVPDNVYLIGTMNTADRSLAGLDLALRRRFTFREMPPRPELLEGVTVEGVDIGGLLAVLNERIEILLDRDHRIGHAYFMELAGDESKCTLSHLADIFREKILPLLQEYFFEDWQRIQWVLNDHRKQAPDCFVYQRALDATGLFGAGVDLPRHSLPWCINEEAFERPEAYRGIIDAQLVALQAVEREAEYGGYTVKRLASGSIQVWRAGKCEPVVKPVLRELAAELDVELVNEQGTLLNTRQLGVRVLSAMAVYKA